VSALDSREQPTAEWQRQADAEPYRIGAHVTTGGRGHSRSHWYVYDCRAEDQAEVAGPFHDRLAAVARAGVLNAENGRLAS
jgi:GH24 family phage-related lysozyme (muramidase)